MEHHLVPLMIVTATNNNAVFTVGQTMVALLYIDQIIQISQLSYFR